MGDALGVWGIRPLVIGHLVPVNKTNFDVHAGFCQVCLLSLILLLGLHICFLQMMWCRWLHQAETFSSHCGSFQPSVKQLGGKLASPSPGV